MKNTKENKNSDILNFSDEIIANEADEAENQDKKPSFFGRLFTKKAKSAEENAGGLTTEPTAENSEEKPKKGGLFGFFGKKAKSADQSEGNAFTDVFSADAAEKEQDFIGTIIETAKEQKEADKNQFNQITNDFAEEKNPAEEEEEVKELNPNLSKKLQIAKMVFMLSFIVPITSFAFYWLQLSGDNFIAKALSLDTPSKVLAQNEVNIKAEQDDLLVQKRKYQDYLKKTEDLDNNKILADVMENRIDWLEVDGKIDEIIKKNFKTVAGVDDVVVYTGFSGRTDDSTVTVQGEVRDESGQSMTRLGELVTALNASDNFSGAEVRNFSKKEDSKTGKYISSFNLNFTYTSDAKLAKAQEESLKAAQ